MADEPTNGNGKGNARIKFLSVVVATLVWYVISENITINIFNNPGQDKGEKPLANQAAQDKNATDKK